MNKFGLKLWSNNNIYIKEAIKLYKAGIYQYIELYVIPGSYDEMIALWKGLDIPFIIHAPHLFHDVNLAIKEKRASNKRLLADTFKFADALEAKSIIFHAGTAGTVEETATQLKSLSEKRSVIENKPYLALDEKNICNGNSPDEIKYIIEKTGAKFCLDIGHAISSANSHKADPIGYIKAFQELKPLMFHFTDGDYKSELDRHDHFGSGNYPVKQIMKMLPKDCSITIESVKGSESRLDDFANDVKYLKELS